MRAFFVPTDVAGYLFAWSVTGLWFASMAVITSFYQPTDHRREIEDHLRKACEISWAGPTAPSVAKIERCTKRAMAAMGTDDRLRDNELKRLLMQSEHDLAKCGLELDECRGE